MTPIPPPPVRPAAPAAPAMTATALRALRLEALLGDPRDARNPCGLHALATAAAPPRPAAAAVLLTPQENQLPGGAQEFTRILRPASRRGLALGHAWGTPTAPPAWTVLLGQAGLVAAAGGVLRDAAAVVDARGHQEPGVRQWRPALAAVFADLLALESLTALALRTHPPHPHPHPHPHGSGGGGGTGGEGSGVLVAAAGYAVPHLATDLLDDLELVLNECGFAPASLERLRLTALVRDRAAVRADWTAAAAWQARLVRLLPAPPTPAANPGPHPLFRLTGPLPATGYGAQGDQAVQAALTPTGTGTGSSSDGSGEGEGEGEGEGGAALGRLARRLVTEQRALRAACRTARPLDPADPAARALADRQALLLVAAAVLGVRQAAARQEPPGFLARPDWALLALTRITQRLGVPLPDTTTRPQDTLWSELATRTRHGIDCDLHATRLLW
ncbi:hypothetical protein [Streptomyces sp. NPDC005423]|uniref:hypothetical protein n=1 Tax=Streptomyces sp. NPDC005423 TaxID=3155343 RepID=UPI0033B67336